MTQQERDNLRFQAESAGMRRDMELSTREDYVEAKVLSQDEIDKIAADAIGMDLQEYKEISTQMMKTSLKVLHPNNMLQ